MNVKLINISYPLELIPGDIITKEDDYSRIYILGKNFITERYFLTNMGTGETVVIAENYGRLIDYATEKNIIKLKPFKLEKDTIVFKK
jgi:hypothetical protein